MDGGTQQSLTAIWGSAADDIWASGNDVLLHWDGRSWSSDPAKVPECKTLWGTSATDVWAAGAGGALRHWNGKQWSPVQSGVSEQIGSLWGSGPDDVWAAAGWDTLLHWDGRAWAPVPMDWSREYRLGGSAANDVWAVGPYGTTLHFDGQRWAAVTGGPHLEGLWAAGPRDLWAVGERGTLLRWDGASWNAVPCPTRADLESVWGSGPNDVWAVGQEGTILHWDGKAWKQVESGIGASLQAVWGSAGNDVWAVGFGGAVHWNGRRWAQVGLPVNHLHAVWGAGKADVWVAAGCVEVEEEEEPQEALLRWNGKAWSYITQPCCSATRTIWGLGAKDVWFAGYPERDSCPGEPVQLQRWNGKKLVVSAGDIPGDGLLTDGLADMAGLWGRSADDVWAVGSEVVHWDGKRWTVEEADPACSLNAVVGTADGVLWAVGDGGTILRRAGSGRPATEPIRRAGAAPTSSRAR